MNQSSPLRTKGADDQAWAGDPARAVSELDLPRAFAYFDKYYRRHLPTDPSASILDYGCGFGSFLAYLERRGYANCLGFDIDNRCVEFCRKRLSCPVEHAPNGIAFLANQVASFDAILLREVAYYFPPHESQRYFEALRASLKPTGRIIVEVFNGSTATGAYSMMNDHWIAAVFTEHSLRWSLENNGFRVTHLFGATGTGSGARYRLWRTGGRIWSQALRAIYILERGRDSLNPSILDKNLIAIAEIVDS